MKKNNKKAFTIVELVIVIGVIGILSAILIPTFTNLTNSAREAAKQSDLAAVYAEYAADVADGYYGEAEDSEKKADKMYAQDEVYIAKTTTDYYQFVDGKWSTTSITSPALTAANRLGEETYSGYQIYKKA